MKTRNPNTAKLGNETVDPLLVLFRSLSHAKADKGLALEKS
jgi:hypothetical protein